MAVTALSDDWNGPYIQVDLPAEMLDVPETLDRLVEYFRCIRDNIQTGTNTAKR